ncbi:spore germination protein [Thermaerobacter sp. PB12/4term]|uniref:spore germination protein n=1 Tax=Thermaerobacter sp. PB12/4term TaxID=2293838 RepID=UPI000E3273DD|nr:spore germination protein [Thermaerobacter sp. PB12/4term]QIA26143.1 spore germination protein [Thermaerobacter sp. PB12/4term]
MPLFFRPGPWYQKPGGQDKDWRHLEGSLRHLEASLQDLRSTLDRTLLLEHRSLTGRLQEDVQLFKRALERVDDFVVRRIWLRNGAGVALLFIEGLVDTRAVQEFVLAPILRVRSEQLPRGRNLQRVLTERVLPTTGNMRARTIDSLLKGILSGSVVLLVDGCTDALNIDMRKLPERSVEEPTMEPVIRGPRDGFTEDFQTNISLIRRRLADIRFKVEQVRVGRVTHTRVAVCYLQGIANPHLVTEVKSRLHRIEADGILESGYIEEWIEDNPRSIFPQILHTERPDVVAGALLEGRVAIVTDGTPFVLVVPVSLWTFLQTAEDYNVRFAATTALRWLRYLFALVALLLPSLYVAVTTYHPEMLPTPLLMTVAATREGIPFPAVVEALLVEIIFEALREAGVRLPRTIGQTVGIVGAIVIGEAAVMAGIVSAPMVIIVAITGIANFTIARFNLAFAIRLLRFPLMLLAGMFGLYGVILGLMGIVIHLAGLRSFGYPYLAPVAPLNAPDLKDVAVRVPHWAMTRRPTHVARRNWRRARPGLQPSARRWPGLGGAP